MSQKKSLKKDISEIELNILRSLHSHPEFTQRKLSSQLGVSLGSINYCINALVDKGFVKVDSFKKASTKKKYLYLLTRKGILEKTRSTIRFLEKKHSEYIQLQNEIESLKSELSEVQHEGYE